MQISSFNLNLNSPNPEALRDFYANVVGLELDAESGGFKVDDGKARFFIDGHSDVDGPNPDPARTLINFFVEDAKSERERIEAQGVQFIRKEGTEPWGAIISTFVDPDGNYAQLMQFDPTV